MNNGQITVQPQAGKGKQQQQKITTFAKWDGKYQKNLRCLASMTQHFPISYPAIRSKGVSRIVGAGGRKGDIIVLFIKCSYFNIRCSIVPWGAQRWM